MKRVVALIRFAGSWPWFRTIPRIGPISNPTRSKDLTIKISQWQNASVGGWLQHIVNEGRRKGGYWDVKSQTTNLTASRGSCQQTLPLTNRKVANLA